ncbi:MAG TPA: hypothetical protein VMT34_11845 [Aggregatilineales bacterium]|nr:hypothetical protein [Aggregatilineales bacterium]
MSKRWLTFFALGLLVGCTSAAPTPDPNGPILLGFATLPKALATIYFTSTPNPTQVQATLTGQPHPTAIPVTPTFTPSMQPVLGIYMGASTFSTAIGVLPTGSGIPFAIVTLAPGTRTAIAAQVPGAVLPGALPPGAAVPGASVVAVNPGPTGPCAIALGAPFVKPFATPGIQQRIGCPTAAAFNLTMVLQPFQTGYMFWRDTKEVYAVQTRNRSGDSFWRFPDNWHDGEPANDPSLSPPGAGLQQPIRGFGLVWRSNPALKTALGWATAPEQPYQATWQSFERGWMFTVNNMAIAFVPLDGPPVTTGTHFGLMPE